MLRIAAQSEVQVDPPARPDLSQGPSWEQVVQMLTAAPDAETLAARQFSFESPHVPLSSELAEYARASFAPGRPLLQCVLDLTERIYHDFKFLPGSTKVGTPSRGRLPSRQGVCQDFADLQICCLRSMGLAARYVSGYIATRPPPGKARLSGRRCLPCMGQRLFAGIWMGGFRSDERSDAVGLPCHGCLGTRLRRRWAHQRNLDRWPAPLARRLGRCRAHRASVNRLACICRIALPAVRTASGAIICPELQARHSRV